MLEFFKFRYRTKEKEGTYCVVITFYSTLYTVQCTLYSTADIVVFTKSGNESGESPAAETK